MKYLGLCGYRDMDGAGGLLVVPGGTPSATGRYHEAWMEYISLKARNLCQYSLPYDKQPKLYSMKRLLLLSLLCAAMAGQAQTLYFTAYNFTVESKDVGSVYNMIDTYYKANKPDGVSVWLYENHFNESGDNHSHTLVFTGTQEALGGMYDAGQSTAFQLLSSQINAQMSENNGSLAGSILDAYGDDNGSYPFRQLYILDVEDANAMAASFAQFNAANNPANRVVTMGSIDMGLSPHGETHWVLVGFKNMKSALGGTRGLVPESQRPAFDRAWQAHMSAMGDFRIVRNSLMILLGTW